MMISNCAGEDSLESLGQQGDQTSQSQRKSTLTLEGLMLKLKFQYFGHLMWRTDLLEKTLMWGKDWQQKEKGPAEDEMFGWYHWLNGHEFEQTLGEWRTGKPGVLQSMGLQSRTQLDYWTSTRLTVAIKWYLKQLIDTKIHIHTTFFLSIFLLMAA